MNDIIMSTNQPALTQCTDLIFKSSNQQQESDNENTTQESESALSQSQEEPKSDKVNYTEIMMQRWKKACANELQSKDKEDALTRANPQSDSSDMKQSEPEYAQQCYLRIRATEEAYALGDYFEGIKSENKRKGFKPIQPKDRSYAMELMLQLYQARNYSYETLFSAANVFDRYVALVGPQNISKNEVTELAVTCLLIGAKLEQPNYPNFNNMIYALQDVNGETVKREDLIKIEQKILRQFGFDFNFVGPKQFLDRYIRILELELKPKVYKMALQILSLSVVNHKLLAYRPSQIAASSLIIALNIYMAQKHIKKDKIISNDIAFFKNGHTGSQFETSKLVMNTNIWNNVRVSAETGYTMEMLKDCLYDTCSFIQEYLEPNKLKYFEIECVKYIQNCPSSEEKIVFDAMLNSSQSD